MKAPTPTTGPSRSPRRGRCAAMALILALATGGAAAQRAGAIAPDDLARRLDRADRPFVLDVRTPAEFAAGHIPGSVNIPHTELATRLAEIGAFRRQEVVLHCQTGPRAGYAYSILRAAEFTRVRQLDGHMRAWRSGSYPIQ